MKWLNRTYGTSLRVVILAALTVMLVPMVTAQEFVAQDATTYTTCSGTFHDSGGSAGSYSNSESIVTTLCPTGGPAAGPFTSISFTEWQLAAGPGDTLRIFEGITATGTPLLVAGASTSLVGQSFTSTGASGCLTFQWTSNASGVDAGWSALITTGPDAGSDASYAVCSDAPPFGMRAKLGGTAQPGGIWTGPLGQPHTSSFDPSTDPAGVYTYTLAGTAPCAAAVATLTVSLQAAPSAGLDATLTLCSTALSADLFLALGGTPQSGGTWEGPDGTHSGTFDPASDTAGEYVYTVAGTAPCVDGSATVTVVVNLQPDAGTSGSITVCSNNASFQLFSALNDSPDAGGAWTGPLGTPTSANFTPGVSLPGIYTYTLLGAPPCVVATSTVEVTQITAPVVGNSASITLCSDELPFDLIDRLGGSPDTGGSWLGPSGASGDEFDPSTDPAGVYQYTVTGTSPCVNATSSLTIVINRAPVAGLDSSVTVCSTDGALSLFLSLAGTPDAGGSWSDPDGAPHSAMFMPGTSEVGVYTYTLSGLLPCADASATVTVAQNIAPYAGVNATLSLCSSDAQFVLVDELSGAPDAGGSWVGPNGPHGDLFTPGTDVQGAYTYTVAGIAPCSADNATLNISVLQAPFAGVDGDTTVCSNSAPFDLITRLGGGSDLTGEWTGPDGLPHSGQFVPGTDVPGEYTYTVEGVAPCSDDVAVVEVTVVEAPDAGGNGSITVCSDADAVELFLLLAGTPDAGGAWVRPNGTTHSGIYQPGSNPGGTYTYTVAGSTPCVSASASVQVTRVIAPNAGATSSTTLCSTNGAFDLLSVLGGNPSGSGTWSDPAGDPVSSTFTPGTSPTGIYAYSVPGNAPCANDTAFLTVVVNTAPVAGGNASVTICSIDPSFNMVDVLSGTPDAGGMWTAPDASPSDGIYTPGSSLTGGYTYMVPGITPCLNATAVLVVNENRQPVAGANATLELCSTDAPVDLFTVLGGAPDPGGAWVGPSGPLTGIFLPATSPAGIYTYSLSGASPCVNASATVTVVVNQAPNAGTASGISVCSDQASVNLFDGLTGNPDTNGTWSDDDATGQQSGQFFNLLGMPVGSYSFTYTVPGIGQCGDVSSTVVVSIVGQLDAGTNGTTTVCRTNAQVNLFTGLGGAPQPGGQWIDLDGTGAVFNQFFNATLVSAGTYQFRYRLTGTLSCASDSATATVTVVAAPNAGSSNTISLCSVGPSSSLFPALGGNPSGGGVWTFNGQPFSGVFDPVINVTGGYVYTVSGSGPCPNATATVTVNKVAAPNAGISAVATVCTNDGPFNMTLLLGGSPQPGTWLFGGTPHGNVFVPGLDSDGIYVYVVSGQTPCSVAQSTLTITQRPAPNAGNNASITVCSSGIPVVLFTLLGSGAQSGGTWSGPTDPFDGVFVPGTTLPGDYLYTVTGLVPCLADVAVVSVFENTAANAGVSGATTLCTGGPSVNLLSVLGGTPAPTGTWTGPAPSTAAFSGVFVPGTTPPGLYTYTVQGAPPCANNTATVNVGVSPQVNAGCSNAISVCSNANPFSMVARLGCSPAFGGVWTGPAPSTAVADGFFIPGTTAPGLYTYTVAATAPCSSSSATLNITQNTAANAGAAGSITLCSTAGATNLFTLLGPGAQVGGTWTDPNGVLHSGTFLPGVDLAGTYRYTVNGQAPCTSAFALVTVVVNTAPIAGCNGLRVVCSSSVPFTLFSVLGCSPSGNGTWKDPGGATHPGIFLPGISQPGVYTYTVSGSAPCANATAQVTIIQNQAPDAGQDALLSICSDQSSVTLFGQLGGTPGTGGSWRAPDGSLSSGIYVPGTSLPGIYTYRLSALAPCVADSATVTVSQNTAASAGFSTVAFVCSDAVPFPLVDLLGGTPDVNGTWSLLGVQHSPLFNPSVDGTGTYVYTVNGALPCTDAVAQVQITRVSAPRAGTGGTIAACIDDPGIPLFSGLSGFYNTGGTWTDLSATGQLSGSTFVGTGLAAGSYSFTYTVLGTSPCGSASATVVVNITEALNAGDDATVEVCGSQIVELFPLLGGDPLVGGVWEDVDGSAALLGGGVFNANLVTAGTTWRFRYILGASSQCPSDTALLTVIVLEGPYAGCDGLLNLCSTALSVSLASALGCSPDNDGFWFAPDGQAHPAVFEPLTDAPGIYRYVVPGVGSCPADTAQVTVQVTAAANAGAGGSISICSTDVPVDLINSLGAGAQPGGVWRYNGSVRTSIYNPAVDSPGAYTYTVTATSPCPNETATVLVAEPTAPNAGSNAATTVCSSAIPFNMRFSLGGGGVAEGGGTWVGPNGPHGQFFDPVVDPPGNYVYTVQGIAPCPSASATLAVAVNQAGNAGQSNTIAACVGQTSVDLFTALGPLALPGGNWTDVSSSGALVGSVFDPALAGVGSWVFTYGFPSNGPCPAVSSQITVNVSSGSSAGIDTEVEVCGANSSFNLFGALGGTPTTGGTWSDLLGTGALLPGGNVNVTLLSAGATTQYGYTVVDAGCGSVSSVLTITVAAYPVPGLGTTLELCVTNAPVDLFAQLGGSPETTGQWYGTLGAPHGNTFVPGIDPAGNYRYTVSGNAVCPDSSAVVIITVDLPPDAGSNASILVCDTISALDLRASLAGTPQADGVWTSGNWTGSHLASGTVNTAEAEPGTYTFVYTVSNPGCGSAVAELTMELVGGVEVVDVQRICDEQSRTYTVSFVIEKGDPATYSVTGVEGFISSSAPYVFTSTPIFTSQPFELFVTDGFSCKVVRLLGDSPCDFEVGVFVPESFSPNDDGINDAFIIPGIEGYPLNTLFIFNRWGDRMYQATGYDNRSLRWDGSSDSGIAPAGTYYYVLDLGNDTPPLTGFIYLNR